MLLSSLWQKALWIDHHEWNLKNVQNNVKTFVDFNAFSTASLVAKYFGIDSELVSLANEIDKNEVRSEEAKFFRDFIAALKWKYRGGLLNSKLKNVAKMLSLHGTEIFECNPAIAELINVYLKWVKEFEKEILRKTKFFVFIFASPICKLKIVFR